MRSLFQYDGSRVKPWTKGLRAYNFNLDATKKSFLDKKDYLTYIKEVND